MSVTIDLHKYITNKHLLEVVIDTGIDINGINEKGDTLLHAAIKAESYEIVDFLLNKGAKTDIVNSDKHNAFKLAWCCPNDKIATRIVKHMSEVNKLNVHLVDDDILQQLITLIKHDIPSSVFTGRSVAHDIPSSVFTGRSVAHDILDEIEKEIGYLSTIPFPCSRFTVSTGFSIMMLLLIKLDCKGHVKFINNYIVENKHAVNDKNMEGWTALHIVCRNAKKYDESTIQCLLDNGAIIDAVNNKGWTSLMLAIQSTIDSNIDAVKLLLKNGAGIHNKTVDMNDAFMIAICNIEIDVAQALLDYGANIDTINEYHETPLMLNVLNTKLLNFLLPRGAKINVCSTKGDTALSLAVATHFQEPIALLLRYGADPTDAKAWSKMKTNVSAKQIIPYCSSKELEKLRTYSMTDTARKVVNEQLEYSHFLKHCKTIMHKQLLKLQSKHFIL